MRSDEFCKILHNFRWRFVAHISELSMSRAFCQCARGRGEMESYLVKNDYIK